MQFEDKKNINQAEQNMNLNMIKNENSNNSIIKI